VTPERQHDGLETRILEAIASGIIALDGQHRIRTFNRAAEHTFGVRAADLLDRDGEALAASIPELPDVLDTFFASGAAHLRAEVQGRRPPDQTLTLELRMAPLAFAEGPGVAIVVVDRTVQRALEEAHSAQIARTNAIEVSFSRYLAPHVVRTLMKDPDAISLGGTRQRATMLFADIRGFTGIASTLTADRVVVLLNRYFDEAVRVVFAHDGLLDKFYGDGLLAVFGPPLVRDDDARRAVMAAFRLHEAVDRLNEHLHQPLAISIGLATGDVVAGHIGSPQRMDYTVIGDAVNLAAGLQQAAPTGAIYCDAATFAKAGITQDARSMPIRVKGRQAPVDVYRLDASGAEVFASMT
jgi:adenylate cyclase